MEEKIISDSWNETLKLFQWWISFQHRILCKIKLFPIQKLYSKDVTQNHWKHFVRYLPSSWQSHPIFVMNSQDKFHLNVNFSYFPSKCCSYINIQEYNSTLEETKTLINPPIASQATPSSDVVGSDCISVNFLHSRNACVLQINLISFQIYVASVHILPFSFLLSFTSLL